MDEFTVKVSSHKLHYGNSMTLVDYISDDIGMQHCEDTGVNISRHFTNATVSDIVIRSMSSY
jgi:hypothetical protein